MATRCAVDIGGTFTDLVYLDEESGDVGLAKSSTTPGRFEQGVMNVIGEAVKDGYVTVEQAARDYGVILDPATHEVREVRR